MFGLSAFWATVVKVELTDIVFADRFDPGGGRDVAEDVGHPDRRHPRHHHDAAGHRQLLAIVERYPAARRRRVHHHRAGSAIKLLIEYLHADGYIALRDAEVAVARPDRRDLRRCVPLCATSGPAAPRRQCGHDAYSSGDWRAPDRALATEPARLTGQRLSLSCAAVPHDSLAAPILHTGGTSLGPGSPHEPFSSANR